MKKVFYTLALAALCVPAVSARTLTAEEAMQNVNAFLGSGMQKAPARMAGNMKLAGTISDAAGTPTLYLFSGSEGRGIVVASASSKSIPVLGYASDGEFDMDHMPPAMKWWLDCYSAEIAQAESGKTRTVLAVGESEKQTIAPIMKTEWNQNAPYNNLTPLLSGQNCMTGCVATAMAQVMKVHQWPEVHGEGFVSYRWQSQGQQLGVNLAKSTLDWDNMLDTYGDDATDAQKEAVATLMRDCGYATEMQYSLTASGTTVVKLPTALYYNFGYDKGMKLLVRDYYGLADWENIVYGELQAGRPVIFTGVSDEQGGHCFVCDGYSSDRYYHINWGWGGLSDGYFLLSALDPSVQGIGGSASGFNNMVSACVGIQKPVEGSSFYYEVLCDGDFEGEVADGYAVFSANAFYNSTFVAESGSLGVKLTDSKGETQYVQSESTFKFEPRAYAETYRIATTALPSEGTYTVTPAFYCNEDESWHDVPTSLDAAGELILTVENGNYTLSSVEMDVQLSVTNIKLLSDLYTNANFHVSADVVNNGDEEYLGPIMLALVNGDKVVAYTPGVNVDVEAGKSLSLDYMTRFMQTAPNGDYDLYYVTSRLEPISEPIPVSVSAVAGNTSVVINDLRITSGNGAALPIVPANNVSVAGTLECTYGYFADTITAYVFPERGGNSLASLGNATLFVKAGESDTFEFHGSFGNGQVGTTYSIGIFNGQTQLRGTVNFILGDESSVEFVEAPEDVTVSVNGDELVVYGAEGKVYVNVYSVDGKHVLSSATSSLSVASLAQGTYIAVAKTSKGTVMTKFAR